MRLVLAPVLLTLWLLAPLTFASAPSHPQVATYLSYWYNADRGIGFEHAQG